MSSIHKGLILALAAACWLSAPPARAATLTLDYRYDTGHFFGVGTPARATLEAAAGFYSSILNDTLAAVDPPTYVGQQVTYNWTWTIGLNDPSAPFEVAATLVDESIAADEYRIFPGAKVYSGSTLATGKSGWVISYGRNNPSNPSSQDLAQRNLIDAAFQSAVEHRGEASGFDSWGGSISFDSDTVWHTNYLTAPAAGEVDLYSVAIHELGHTLGIGLSTEWSNLVSGSNFVGLAAKAKYGGPVPLNPEHNHWQDGLGSVVYGGSTTQTASLTPSMPPGVRRKLTALDAAALIDLGWKVGPTGDYNRDGIVNAADYTVWRNTRGQNGIGLAADGNGNNQIDTGDFTVWKTHFGQAVPAAGSGAGAFVSTGAPEPTTFLLLLSGVCAAAILVRRR